MIELDYIIKHKKTKVDLKNEHHIYFLIKDDEVVYVGKSTGYKSRIKSHLQTKDFDSYFSLKVHDYEFDYLELYYIDKFQPFYNGNLPYTERYMSISKIKSMYDFKTWDLKRFIKNNNINPKFKLGDQYSYDIVDFESFLEGCEVK